MGTYNFKVRIEPDEEMWSAYCPALIQQGAATWGNTKEEALKNIHEVVHMVVQSLTEHGGSIPEESIDKIEVSNDSEFIVRV